MKYYTQKYKIKFQSGYFPTYINLLLALMQ